MKLINESSLDLQTLTSSCPESKLPTSEEWRASECLTHLICLSRLHCGFLLLRAKQFKLVQFRGLPFGLPNVPSDLKCFKLNDFRLWYVLTKHFYNLIIDSHRSQFQTTAFNVFSLEKSLLARWLEPPTFGSVGEHILLSYTTTSSLPYLNVSGTGIPTVLIPFPNWTSFNHSDTGLVQYSDGGSTYKYKD
jgi:hypothetical protein